MRICKITFISLSNGFCKMRGGKGGSFTRFTSIKDDQLRFTVNSWFSLTSYQNSEALNNRFGFQNVYGIVENSKLHIWAKF